MKKLLLLLCSVWFTSTIYAQQVVVKGTVTDAAGVGIPGVTIQVKNSSVGTVTDLEGGFSLQAKEGDILVFRSMGYAEKEVTIDSETLDLKITLSEDIAALEEVVVVGYGSQKKSLLTGAISKVKTEDLEQSRSLRVEQALQGRTAGVTVMSNSGQPGDNFTIRIRGVGTNGNPDPLFIVDGLPLSKEALDFLNPSDIESLEILKDAAATAIYGARGANGVVLITTKSGKSGRMSVTYDGYYGVQQPWRKLNLLNAEQYVSVINAQAANANKPPVFSPNYTGYRNLDSLRWDTDWQDQMFYSGAPKTSHTLSFSGGSEGMTYSSSLSYFGQEGIVARGNSEFERITYRLNVEKKFDKLTLGSNINLANIESKGISANDFFSGNSLANAMNMPPIVPVTFDDGVYGTPEDMGVPLQEITNPIAILDVTNQRRVVNKVIAGVTANYQLTEELSATLRYGTEYAYVNSNSYIPEYNIDATHRSNSSFITRALDKYVRWNLDAFINYNKTVGKQDFSFTLGTNSFKEWGENMSVTKQDLIFDEFNKAYLDNATNPDAVANGGYNVHTIRSYFGRLNYSFDGKYIASFVMRADGSSRFGPKNKFGYFPAASFGWVASKESFFPQNDLIGFFKLRASWGQTGSDNIGDFAYTTLLNNGLITYFGENEQQVNGVATTNLANPSLRWETSEQLDIGFDASLFDGSVMMTFDYFNKSTKDWLVTAPIVPSAGNGAPVANGGEVRNSGIELELNYFKEVNDFSFDFTLTGAYLKNEVVSINNEGQELLGGEGGFGQSSILRAVPGLPIGHFYGYLTDGIFQTQEEIEAYVGPDGNPIQPNAVPGDFRFQDLDGDGSIDDANDRTILGSPYPDWTMGFNLGITWKNFDLNAFWYASIGQQIWNGTRRYDVTFANFTTEVFNAWDGPGTSNTYPRLTEVDDNGNWSRPSDFFIEDADYLRLRNLTLGYNVSLPTSSSIKQLRFYLSSENLITLTKYSGYEPEIGGAPFQIGVDKGIYPNARTFLGGMKVTF